MGEGAQQQPGDDNTHLHLELWVRVDGPRPVECEFSQRASTTRLQAGRKRARVAPEGNLLRPDNGAEREPLPIG
jgi:hypothetical protein